ncbi:MerR family transcriptional regulator [Agrobacterium vitis]|uniref:MerR family transcriptional regulator n=1 Tax=Agrobacterium vitis TaxID=373 RepID=UPI0015748007|nr:MerR family transcriptional regulator [Agrobacterium vitis]NSZ15342.1 MerR family transcriptional regulator [Agrobacterium vitis]QZO04210.1 MerR family transcriptional regulator [Agrobacterium vitis]UJL89338.1 MerR family transcriptional regulator [Agrobacterium vitis]
MDIHKDKFSTGDVIKATGVTNATLQSWLKRGIIMGQKDAAIEGGGSPGLHRRYSFATVMEIAVAKALIDSGVTDLGSAFYAAKLFAYSGGDAFSEQPENPEQPVQPERFPALPHSKEGAKNGRSLLCVSGKRAYATFWKPGDDPFFDILAGLDEPLGFVMLLVDELFDRVVGVLGYHPQAILDAAYPEKPSE